MPSFAVLGKVVGLFAVMFLVVEELDPAMQLRSALAVTGRDLSMGACFGVDPYFLLSSIKTQQGVTIQGNGE